MSCSDDLICESLIEEERAAMLRAKHATECFTAQHASLRDYLLAELEYADALLDCHAIMKKNEPLWRQHSEIPPIEWTMPPLLVLRAHPAKKSPLTPSASVATEKAPAAASAVMAKKKARTDAYEIYTATLDATETLVAQKQLCEPVAQIDMQIDQVPLPTPCLQSAVEATEPIVPSAAVLAAERSDSLTSGSLDELASVAVARQAVVVEAPTVCAATIAKDTIVDTMPPQAVAQNDGLMSALARAVQVSAVSAEVDAPGPLPALRVIPQLGDAPVVKKPQAKGSRWRPAAAEENRNVAIDAPFTHVGFEMKTMLDRNELHNLDPWAKSLASETGFSSHLISYCMQTDIKTRRNLSDLSGTCACCNVSGTLTHSAFLDNDYHAIDSVCRDRIAGLRALQKFVDDLRKNRASRTNAKWAKRAGDVKVYFRVKSEETTRET